MIRCAGLLGLKITLLLSGISLVALAHEGHHHGPSAKQMHEEPTLQKVTKIINDEYLKSVKPIFVKKCFDCHSDQTRYPWYHSIPGIKQFLDSDIMEAKKHLDFSHDFPFTGHGAPADDFKAIQEAIQKDSMPPFRYRFMHSGAALTDEEKQIVIHWSDEGLPAIEKATDKKPISPSTFSNQ